MARNPLGQSELLILGVLARRARGAHGTALLDDLLQITGREWSVGALYTTLERLEKKGYVASQWGEPTPQRGGRRKRVFQVQAAGQQALEHARRMIIGLAIPPGTASAEA